MRPTIPLAEWRLAVDVGATRALTAEADFPTRDCRCDDCGRWAALYREAFPAELLEELQRVGVDPAHPSDVYTLHDDGVDRTLRLTFHVIGRILSGPADWAPSGEQSAGRNYVPYSASRHQLGLAVWYESLQSLPTWASEVSQPLIAIDLWLNLPGEAASGGPSARRAQRRHCP